MLNGPATYSAVSGRALELFMLAAIPLAFLDLVCSRRELISLLTFLAGGEARNLRR
jgi:hypothetical protein